MQPENAKSTRPPVERLFYRPKEIPPVTGIGLTKVWELIADGTLESRLVGKTRIVTAESVKRLGQGGE